MQPTQMDMTGRLYQEVQKAVKVYKASQQAFI